MMKRYDDDTSREHAASASHTPGGCGPLSSQGQTGAMTGLLRETATMSHPGSLDSEGPDLTIAEVAERLRVHRVTVSRYLNSGQFSGAYRVGRDWRIPQRVLIEFIRAREQS